MSCFCLQRWEHAPSWMWSGIYITRVLLLLIHIECSKLFLLCSAAGRVNLLWQLDNNNNNNNPQTPWRSGRFNLFILWIQRPFSQQPVQVKWFIYLFVYLLINSAIFGLDKNQVFIFRNLLVCTACDCPCQSSEATAVGNIGEGDPCSLADDRGLLFFFFLL